MTMHVVACSAELKRVVACDDRLAAYTAADHVARFAVAAVHKLAEVFASSESVLDGSGLHASVHTRSQRHSVRDCIRHA